MAWITLARSSRHNALVPDLLEDLGTALAIAGADPAAGAVVLEATGPSFSTGGDLAGFAAHLDDPAALRDYAGRLVGALNDVVLAIAHLPVPVVAAVQGPVTGGSLGLLLAADVVLATPAARIAPWYAAVGFAPDGGWTALLPGVIGAARVREVLLTDRTIEPAEALALGLVHAVVDPDHLRGRAHAVAARMAGVPAGTTTAVRALLADTHMATRLEAEREAFVAQITSDQASHGIQRWLSTRTVVREDGLAASQEL